MPARSGTTAPALAADHAVFEDRSFEVSSVEESIFSQERMQETIAKGLRNLENYDPYLRQETDGQYAMVIQEDPKEDPKPEKQITGQLNLEEIMNEWEKVKRDFYEYNGLEDDAPPQKPSASMKKAPLSDVNREDTGSTKSWDPGEVHKALEIRDNEEESAGCCGADDPDQNGRKGQQGADVSPLRGLYQAAHGRTRQDLLRGRKRQCRDHRR